MAYCSTIYNYLYIEHSLMDILKIEHPKNKHASTMHKHCSKNLPYTLMKTQSQLINMLPCTLTGVDILVLYLDFDYNAYKI